MIILAYKPGQLANCIFLHAQILAFGKEHNVKVVNFGFYSYAQFFPTTSGSILKGKTGEFVYKSVFYVTRVLYKLRIFNRYIVSLEGKNFSLGSPENIKKLSRNFILLQGWGFEASNLLKKQKSYLQEYFKPNYDYILQADNVITALKGFDLVIGVHIRRGDYKEFMNGKYFYSIASYVALMEKTKAIFGGKKVVFIVCSNDKLTKSDFPTLDVFVESNHFLVDLMLLSKCNYIFGPPSTFSMWASYYGNVPLYQVENLDFTPTLTDFKIVTE